MQAIPELAKVAGHLYVFQRTPSTIDVRDQRATTPEEIETWRSEQGWARARRARFAKLIGSPGHPGQRRLPGGQGRDARRRAAPGDGPRLTREERTQRELETSFRIMEQIRDRVDAIVDDPKTAAALKPYYPYGCKRPTFHDEYLPTFNQPNVTLVDVAPMGVREINERGVVHDGVQYDLDVLIYATGFDFMAISTFNLVTGPGGRTLAEKWQEEGTRTFLGLHTRGLPEPVHRGRPAGGGGSFNFLDTIDEHSDYVVWMLQTMRDGGHHVVDVREDDEERWAQHCAEADLATAPLRDCLSNFNRYGQAATGLARLLRRRPMAQVARRGPGDARALRLRTRRPSANVVRASLSAVGRRESQTVAATEAGSSSAGRGQPPLLGRGDCRNHAGARYGLHGVDRSGRRKVRLMTTPADWCDRRTDPVAKEGRGSNPSSAPSGT